MKKVLDLVLAVLLLGAFALGAYSVGQAVTRESDEGFIQSSTETSTAKASTGDSKFDLSERLRENRPAVFAIVLVLVAILLVTLLSATRTSIRRRRSKHRPPWRLRQ